LSIKGIAFDIDGTLYPNFQMFLLSMSSFIRNPRLAWHFSRNRKAIRKMGEISDFRRVQAEMIAREMGKDPEVIYRRVENCLYRNWEKAFRHLRPYRDARRVIAGLKDRGYRLGVLSDFPPQNKLKYMGLEGLWDVCFSSEEVHYLKPRPEPFLELARRMGLPPEEILYVGNSFHYDILGASGAGMKTAWLSRKPLEPPADIRFRSYRELETKLRDFLAL